MQSATYDIRDPGDIFSIISFRSIFLISPDSQVI